MMSQDAKPELFRVAVGRHALIFLSPFDWGLGGQPMQGLVSLLFSLAFASPLSGPCANCEAERRCSRRRAGSEA